jgi:hypothetical protein
MEERRALKNREVFWSEFPRDSERYRGGHYFGGEGGKSGNDQTPNTNYARRRILNTSRRRAPRGGGM